MTIFGAKIQNKLLQNDLLLLFSYVFQHLKRDQFIMEKKLGWRELGGVGWLAKEDFKCIGIAFCCCQICIQMSLLPFWSWCEPRCSSSSRRQKLKGIFISLLPDAQILPKCNPLKVLRKSTKVFISLLNSFCFSKEVQTDCNVISIFSFTTKLHYLI